jgi:hypothetical protein
MKLQISLAFSTAIWFNMCSFWTRKEEIDYESSQFRPSHLRELPHHPPQGRGARYLHQSAP